MTGQAQHVAQASVLVMSQDGCGASSGFGPILAAELDARGIEWSDVVVGPAAHGTGTGIHLDTDRESFAVAAIGPVADEAVAAATLDTRVVAVLLVAAPLSDESVGLLSSWKEVPSIVVADAAEPSTLSAGVRIYATSTHPDRDLEVVTDLDIGDEEFQPRERLASIAIRTAVERIERALASGASRREVVCTTSDGWEIHGTLSVPNRETPVPGAVLLHSGRSDRAVFARLERLLTRRGVAVLNIDWRGRGMSQNVATYFELSADDRAEGSRDVAAAIDVLAGDDRVDADRIALLGIVHGAEHAVAGSIGDRRVRMLGLLTGYVPRNDQERDHLVSGDVEVLYITCAGHAGVTAAMHELVAATPAGRASLREYPGGAIGYQLFDIDPGLEDSLAAWVASGLGAGGA